MGDKVSKCCGAEVARRALSNKYECGKCGNVCDLTDKPEEKLYICPEADKCKDKYDDNTDSHCPHAVKHEQRENCLKARKGNDCPSCIPYLTPAKPSTVVETPKIETKENPVWVECPNCGQNEAVYQGSKLFCFFCETLQIITDNRHDLPD